ncbi:carbamoyl phosphate synthase small subunit, partial [Candidatus Woesearchaeota archaeon]|nr:carbamoyl phosphate synthase small subunit [Candidatus Woesearchaeota archaeon]
EKGVMLGKIINTKDVEMEDPNLRNLAAEVSTGRKTTYNSSGNKTVVVIDCGVKLNIIRSLIRRNCKAVRVPWDYDFLKEDYDGVVISNGPGDPKMCTATIKNVAAAMKKDIPIFGICLGNQIMALAAGGDTYKLKYGHRSQNQPCVNKITGHCYITTQNHGYAVNMKTMPPDWDELFANANDGTNEGLRHKTKPFMSVQFHPEATPGPVDAEFLFDEFMRMMK